MHLKFLEHGTGSGEFAASYLVGTHDHNGIRRAEVRVLRGDPRLVGKIADSLHFKNRYTSGVIAFAPTDKPTPEQIEEVLEQFERVAFAGISKKRVAYSAILHVDNDGSCHIHIFCARVDLKTGKSFNIAPPGWEKSFDPLRDYFNYTHGWSRPDDPLRARHLQPGKRALINAQALKLGLAIEPDTKAIITEYLEQQIAIGNVRDRASMLMVIQEAGFGINRAGKDYITVMDENNKKFRLKGVIYDASWNVSRTFEIENSRAKIDGKPDERSARAAHKELENAIGRRTKYNQGRYKPTPNSPEIDAQEYAKGLAVGPVLAFNSQRLPVSFDSVSDNSVELVAVKQDERPDATETAANKDAGGGVLRESVRPEILQKELKNDGIRANFNELIAKIWRTVGAANDAFNRAIGLNDGELSSLKSTDVRFVEAIGALRTKIKQMTVNNENNNEALNQTVEDKAKKQKPP